MSSMQIAPRRRRCAVYTRKSFEPPIGQEITSLESQRAICSAYIASQQHKGWVLAPGAYDDAGRTGANLNRPALRDLMADIEAGLIEIVVVYKLDRITRTLLDFVRLIDFFDRFGVAFVSITQNFDTSDSMGRLIRNVLLTFAQFEREIASDRMRDKKMVMRQHGLWTGGDPPLGYDVREGRLAINLDEAPAVRCIFETYAATGRVSLVHKRLLEEGHRRAVRRTRGGTQRGGGPISLTSLHHVLRNRAYIGEAVHRSESHPGAHEPIIGPELWGRVQAVLKEREQFKPRQPRHILTGLLHDAFGRRMHAREVHGGNASGRYYASASATWAARQRVRAVRLRADATERLVMEAVKRLMSERTRLRPLLLRAGTTGGRLDELCECGTAAALRLATLDERRLSSAVKLLLARVEVGEDMVSVVVRVDALALFLAWDGVGLFAMSDLDLAKATQVHVEEVAVAMTRERKRNWLPLETSTGAGRPCARLVALLDEATAARELVFKHRDVEVAALARSLGRKSASFSRLVRLSYLAPDIVAAIVDGTQPPELTRRVLLECDLPTDWGMQRRILGFPEQRENWRRHAR
ncbi:Site-specific DNA recombinase [Sphingomonas guangdongensis]|uniref:Site-specific DNA recombinase n=1 Tax=Sphingomonas guangdongensis TaxID=1141890 RepID=A0A285QFV6_9SPHN|nr:recombinase family protein [Sphingomonas guangdongensis]SOB80716.1 Site-specific DNA recombinase [Sphingomonas guangdongensis]